jgi:cytochrome c553
MTVRIRRGRAVAERSLWLLRTLAVMFGVVLAIALIISAEIASASSCHLTEPIRRKRQREITRLGLWDHAIESQATACSGCHRRKDRRSASQIPALTSPSSDNPECGGSPS